jgi:hypothetical protein
LKFFSNYFEKVLRISGTLGLLKNIRVSISLSGKEAHKEDFRYFRQHPFFIFFELIEKKKKDVRGTGKERFRAGYPSGKEDGSYALNEH